MNREDNPFNQYIGENIHEHMDEIAHELFFNCSLKAKDTLYRIMEIEFYIYSKKFPDIYTHKNSKQKRTFSWYFHQMTEKEGSYKNGSFKGLDITMGSNGEYTGIIIRSVQNIQTGERLDGPCICVNKFLELNDCKENIPKMIEKMPKDQDIFGNFCLTLVSAQHPNIDVFKCPRIGLNMKTSAKLDIKRKYVAKPLRYVLEPKKMKKGKTMTILLSLTNGEKDKIKDEFKLNDVKLKKYEDQLDTLKKEEYNIKHYVGKLLKDPELIHIYLNENV